MEKEDPEYESQFGDSELGKLLKERYRRTKHFYLQYPTEDAGFMYVRTRDKLALVVEEHVAYSMIVASPYFPFIMKDSMKWTAGHIHNKGALRLTTPDHGQQLWLYNHDGVYFLLTPGDKDFE